MISVSILGASHLTHTLLQGLSQNTSIPIRIYNRTAGKLNELKAVYPNLIFCANMPQLAASRSFIILNIPGSAILNLENEFIAGVKSTDSILISCAGSLKFEVLEKKYPGVKIIRALPSINWSILKGVTFIKENSLVTYEEMNEIKVFFSAVSLLAPLEEEDDFDKIGELSSCFPGLLSELLTRIFAAFNIKDDMQKNYLYHAILGSITNLIDTCKTPDQMIEEVAVKGGLTEAGVNALKATMPKALAEVKTRMDKKIESRIDNFSKA